MHVCTLGVAQKAQQCIAVFKGKKMKAVCADDVKARLLSGKTYIDISDELKWLHPSIRGFLERNVRRCVSNLKQICREEKKLVIEANIKEVALLVRDHFNKKMEGFMTSCTDTHRIPTDC